MHLCSLFLAYQAKTNLVWKGRGWAKKYLSVWDLFVKHWFQLPSFPISSILPKAIISGLLHCLFSCLFLVLSLPFLSTARITKIFITHLHGDHIFGLPGLLCTLSLQSGPDAGSKAPLDIYGPLGLRSFLWRSLELSHSQLLFPYAVHELVPTRDQCPQEEFKDFSGWDSSEALPQGPPGRVLRLDPGEDSYLLLEDEQLVVRAFRLFHRVPSFGFVLQEKPRPGRLDVQRLKELGSYSALFLPSLLLL